MLFNTLRSSQGVSAYRGVLGRSASSRSAGSISSAAYRFVFRQPATYLAVVLLSGAGVAYVYDSVTKSIWTTVNRGKLYDDVIDTFKEEEEEEEEEEDF